MKRNAIFICMIGMMALLVCCVKHQYYYQAYCESGHASWEGPKHEHDANGAFADTQRSAAQTEARDHDQIVHNGVQTAKVRHAMD